MKPSLGPLPPPMSPSRAAVMHPPPAAGALVIESPSFAQPYYLHPPPHHHHLPPPPLPPAPAMIYSSSEQQKIRTLFVSGLPDDVKPREIHNLFRRRPGFDCCLLEYTGRGNQAVAFATFFNHQAAMAAMSQLDGVVFDPASGATLHIELARSNSRKRSRGAGAYLVIDKRVKVGSDNQETSSSDGDNGSDETSDTDSDKSNKKDAGIKSLTSSDGTTNKLGESDAANNRNLNKLFGWFRTIRSMYVKTGLKSSPARKGKEPSDIPPCSTLFIANLGPTCTEEELKKVLSKYSGFKILKMRGRSGMPVAFADFTDIKSSTAAINSLRGTMLESSDRGGMNVEYARSKMRKS